MRPSKEAWILDDREMPLLSTGHQCVPANPDYWWFPEVGLSVPESRIYDTKADAIVAASKALHQQMDAISARIIQLRREEI